MASLVNVNCDISPWNFKNNHNTIIFNDNHVFIHSGDIPNSCCINISVEVKPMRVGERIDYWYFDVSYSHTITGKEGIYMHPLAMMIEGRDEGDETLYEGIMLAANPITFHMLEILLSNDVDSINFNTGSRPFKDYQGEIMRALTEFEN